MYEKLTLFERFGGTRKMADALGEAPSTVQSWKAAGRIPAGHQPKVLEKGREQGLAITAEDVVFPMGQPDTPDRSASATEWPVAGAEPPPPFAQAPEGQRSSGASAPTCSPTSGRSSSSQDSPAFPSSSEAEAA